MEDEWSRKLGSSCYLGRLVCTKGCLVGMSFLALSAVSARWLSVFFRLLSLRIHVLSFRDGSMSTRTPTSSFIAGSCYGA